VSVQAILKNFENIDKKARFNQFIMNAYEAQMWKGLLHDTVC